MKSLLSVIVAFLGLSFLFADCVPVCEESDWKCETFSALGYRYDRQKFVEFDIADPSLIDTVSKFKDRQTVMFSLGAEVAWKWLFAGAMGSYGWLAHGDFEVTSPLSSLTPPGYSLGAGYTADARAILGVRFPLYDRPAFGFFLIPAGGYQYNHIMNDISGKNLAPIVDPAADGYAIIGFPKPNQQDWFGPFVRGAIEFRFQKCVEWLLFYQYHWPDLRSKTQTSLDFYAFTPPGSLAVAQLNAFNSVIHGQGLRTQLGGTDIRFLSESNWDAGLHFEGSKTTSNRCRIKTRVRTEGIFPAPAFSASAFEEGKASVTWVQYSASLYACYRF